MRKISVLATALLSLSACSSFKEPCYYELGLTANRAGNTHDLFCAWGKRLGPNPSWQDSVQQAFAVQAQQAAIQHAEAERSHAQRLQEMHERNMADGRAAAEAGDRARRERLAQNSAGANRSSENAPSPPPLLPIPAPPAAPATPDVSSALKRIDRFSND